MQTHYTGRIPSMLNLHPIGYKAVRTAVLLTAFLIVLPAYAAVAQEFDKEEIEKKHRERVEEQERQLNGTAALELPVNDSLYFVGPGDELYIGVFATQYYKHLVKVQSDGTIVVPALGTVHVHQNTLRDVQQKLTALLQQQMRKGRVIVSLATPRKVKVTVTGTIRKPGIVILPATSRVSEALDLTGGQIEDTTAIRNIAVRHIDGTMDTADLLRYYRTGDLQSNPFVTGGDVIIFPRKDRLIGIFGAVKHEGWIDYVPGETLRDAFVVAQGLKANAFLDSVEVVRFLDDNLTTERIFLDLTGYPNGQYPEFALHPNDLILVRGIPKYREHQLVVVEGEVNYEGSYGIVEGQTTLLDVVHWAGGFTQDASLEEATVRRETDESERDREFERLQKIPAADMTEDEYEYFKARSRERVGQMVVNFKKLFRQGDTSQNIYLRDGDFIEVPIRKNYIRVIGRVNSPGNVIFEEGWNFEDYIQAAGGYGWRAEDGDVRVIKARSGELVDAEDTEDYDLEPGDTIWVPEEPELKFWEIALETLGVLSQVAGILGIVIAVSR